MLERIDQGANAMKKRIQLGTLIIAVSLVFCAPASATEPDESLKDKRNPDQHYYVSDSNWYTFYMDPGTTSIYVYCNGVTPNKQNLFEVNCKTPAVWVDCASQFQGDVPYAYCECTSLASEQHSGQYQINYCPGGG